MEYTNGQPIEVHYDGAWRPAIYIGVDHNFATGEPIDGLHVIAWRAPKPDDADHWYENVTPSQIRPILTREERIESLIDDYVFAATDFGLSVKLGGDNALDRRAALYAILDAEVPE